MTSFGHKANSKYLSEINNYFPSNSILFLPIYIHESWVARKKSVIYSIYYILHNQ